MPVPLSPAPSNGNGALRSLERTPSSSAPAVAHPEWARLGLTDVEPDSVPVGEEDASEVRITGRAMYDPSVMRLDGFPGQDAAGAGADGGRRSVRYRLAPMAYPSAMGQSLRLRRIYSILVSPPPPSPLVGSSRSAAARVASEMVAVPVSPKLLGTWNSTDGLWAVFDGEREKDEVELGQWVRDQLADRDNEQHPKGKAEVMWGDVLEVFIQVVAILAGLHARSLALVACRPDFFVIACRPGGRSSANPAHPLRSTGTPLQVRLCHLAQVVRLGHSRGMDPLRSDSGYSPELELAIGSLSVADADGADEDDGEEDDPDRPANRAVEIQIGEHYGEVTLRRHLRYLAPETLGLKNGTQPADIYSFGVFAYELLTGQQTEPSTSTATTADLLTLIHQHVNAPVPTPLEQAPRLPSHLAHIISLALSPDTHTRYHSTAALQHDLTTLQSILYSSSPTSSSLKFRVGEVNKLSRLELPSGLVEREPEMASLTRTLESVRKTGQGGVLCWGVSGSGKSKLVSEWVAQLDKETDSNCLVATAKFDQHTKTPLSGYVQLFSSILDRLFSDPAEDSVAWKQTIVDALSSQGSGSSLSTFAVLIPQAWRAVLFGSDFSVDERTEDPEWTNFTRGFRNVAQSVLQTFATAERPLVLILDDVQWADEQETKLWQSIFNSGASGKLKNVMLVEIHRVVDAESCPPSDEVLARSSTPIAVQRLSEAAVGTYLSEIFKWSPDELHATYLVAFLYEQTLGTPFFLRTLVSSLVRSGTVYFDYARLKWVFDMLDLQDHASLGVDHYVARTLYVLPPDVKSVLGVLSCLPARGVPISLLAGLVNRSMLTVEGLLLSAEALSAVVVEADWVRFAHDRIAQSAADLIASGDVAQTCSNIATYLKQAGPEYLFETVDNFLRARRLGLETERRAELASLACHAAQRATRAASLQVALAYLASAAELVAFDVAQTWAEERELCALYARTLAETSAIALQPAEAVPKIRSYIAFCETRLEKVEMSVLYVRLLQAANDFVTGINEALVAVKLAGYDTLNLADDLRADFPASDADLDALERSAFGPAPAEPTEEDQLAHAVTILIGLVGSVSYVMLPDHGKLIFGLALRLAARHPLAGHSPAIAFILGMASMQVSRLHKLDYVKASIKLAARLVHERARGSIFFSIGLVTVTAQEHVWKPMKDITYKPAWDSAVRGGDLTTAAYVLGLDCYTALLCGRLFRENMTPAKAQWFESVSDFQPVGRAFVNVARQTVEHIQSPVTDAARAMDPSTEHRFDGSYITHARDWPLYEHYPTHRGAWILCETWAGFLVPGPDTKDYLGNLITEGDKLLDAIAGTVWEPEWMFVKSIYYLTYGTEDEQPLVDGFLEELSVYKTPDFDTRAAILVALIKMRAIATSGGRLKWHEAVDVIQLAVEQCERSVYPGLLGLIAFSAARFLDAETKNPHLVAGYAQLAYRCYITARVPSAQEMVLASFPNLVKRVIPSDSSSAEDSVHPAFRRPSTKSQNDTDSLSAGGGSSKGSTTKASEGALAAGKTPKGGMDDLESKLNLESFLRTTLLIAGEKDPSVLIVKVMAVLLQFTRSSYGALAIVDNASGNLHLRSAGSFSGLTSYDRPLADVVGLAPVSIIQHVGTTKQPITTTQKLQELGRSGRDGFLSESPPKSVLVLPISNQGRFSGVVYLSSRVDSTGPPNVHAVEVVTALSILACISVESHLSTRLLEQKVAERTADLTKALSSSSTFLSHMSHEMRSPLYAVLGLASVLEDSPGLNNMQREQLATIRTSGEDLKRIIGDLLDFSRLESGSVQVESIPFSLRDVVEAAIDGVATRCQTAGVEIVLLNSVMTDPETTLQGDPFRIKQVLLNLLSNSSKFVTHGKVTVEWTINKLPGSDDQSTVKLSVSDTGPGIPPQKMSRLFKSFSQVDSSITRQHGGSGLGLAISQSLARLMGGQCSATSVLGEGSTFDFEFVVKNGQRTLDSEKLMPFQPPERSAFLLSKPSETRRVMEENLAHFRIIPIHKAPTFEAALSDSDPNGLRNREYDFVLVHPDLITPANLQTLRSLQPKAKFRFVTRVVDIASVVAKLRMPHSALISRPTKAAALYEAVRHDASPDSASASSPTPTATTMKPTKSVTGLDRTLAKNCPLRIMIVDDSKVNLMVGLRVCERFGYGGASGEPTSPAPVTAENGQIALDKAERTPFDLILMDLSMPVLDGYAANARILASPLTGSPVVIALTANADTNTVEMCQKQGFFAHLVKPLNIPALAHALRTGYEEAMRRKGLERPISPESLGQANLKSSLEVYLMGC